MSMLENKVVLVTGAGRGVGRAHAIELAKNGARVVVNDLGADVRGEGSDKTAAETVAAEIRSSGGEAVVNYEDISTWDGAKRAVQSGIDAFGELHGLVNNAGNLRKCDLADLNEGDFDATVRVHLKGSFACTVHACHYWRALHAAGKSPNASVVNTISDALLVGLPGYSIYGAVKGAIAHLTTVGSREGAAYGVRVNAYGPRALTRMSNVAYSNPGTVADEGPHPKDPANSSPLIAWLISQQSDHVTGQVFQTIGGGIARCAPWTPEEMIWPDQGRVRFEPGEVGKAVDTQIFRSRFPDVSLAEPPGWDAQLD